MKIFYTLLLLVFLASISCSKDDSGNPEPNPENPKTGEEVTNDSITYFTLNVNEYYLNDNYKSGYIIISNNEGKLVDYKRLENNKQYFFKSKKSEKLDTFSVTRFLSLDEYNANDTFYNINSGTVWNFNGNAPETNTGNSGNYISFNLTVENIYNWQSYSLSGVGSYTGSVPTNGSFIELENISMEESAKIFLTIHFSSNQSKYLVLDNITNNEQITVNGDDLLTFDSYININIPDDENSYYKILSADFDNTRISTTNPSVLITPGISNNLGLLNDFNNHEIVITTYNSAKDFRYQYKYNSNSPNDITIPSLNIDFSIINNDINSFQFETSENHDRRFSLWRHHTLSGTGKINVWGFHSNNTDYNKLPELPEDLSREFPSFEVETLEYQRTVLLRGDTSYSDIFRNDKNENNQEMITETFVFYNPDLNKNKNSGYNSFLNDQDINLLGRK